MIFGDKRLRMENKKLKRQNQELKCKILDLERKYSILVEKLEFIRGVASTPISNCVETKISERAYLFVASKKDSVLLPTGHRAFSIDKVDLLINRRWPTVDGWFCKTYLTTEGTFAYIDDGELLLEEKQGEFVRIYAPLQQRIREENKVILKVTFPKPITEEELQNWLKFDPEVEVVFE